MISTFGCPPPPARPRRRPRRSPAPAARTGRGPSARAGHRGVPASGSSRAAARRRRAASGPPARLRRSASAMATRTAISVRSGRNSCNGGSSSRMVTGRPSIAEINSTKSLRCNGARAARAASRSCRLVRQDDPFDERTTLPEEHVLGPAQPDPDRAQAARPGGVLAGVGVGPHLQPTRARRHSPAPGPPRVTSAAVSSSASVKRGPEALVEIDADRRRHHRHLADEHLTGRPVDGQHVALRHGHATGDRGPRLVSTGEPLGAAHAGLAHPAGDHGGVAGLAAPRGENPVGGEHSAQVVGVGLPADQQHMFAALRPLHGSRRVEDHPTDGRPRRRRHARSQQRCASRGRRTAGNINCANWFPLTRASASSEWMSCSSTSCAAIRKAAAGVRLPTRVCSIHSLPRSMVNSMSHRSR